MEPAHAYFVNSTVYTISILLNQAFMTLSSLVYNNDAGSVTSGKLDLDSGVVDYVNGSDVYGSLGASNTLQLTGPQFSSSGSPIFTITVDQNILPVATSSVMFFIFYNSIVATDGRGLRHGIQIIPKNATAKNLAM